MMLNIRLLKKKNGEQLDTFLSATCERDSKGKSYAVSRYS